MDFISRNTVIDETKSVFKEVNQINEKIDEINHQLATREDYESDSYLDLLNHLNDYNERLNVLGGFSIDADCESILKGLGFTPKDFTRLTDEFSGGWRMCVELAKILLTKSDVLLLDEPTNHLDIESIQWLEDFLKTYPDGVVLVSHDKVFLDNITNRTIEITLGKVHDYKAYYSKYLELRKELIQLGFSVGPKPDLTVTYFWYPSISIEENVFNQKLMEFIHEDGSVFLSSTNLDGKFVIRIAILSFRTKLRTIKKCVKMISGAIEKTEKYFLSSKKL